MKKKKKRGFRIFLLVFIAVIFLLLIAFLLCAYVFKLNTRQVIVHDNNIISNEKIIELSKLEDNNNFLLVKRNTIKKNIKTDGIIKNVKIKKNIFFEVHLYIEEYKPLFYNDDNKKLVLDNKDEIDMKDYYDINVPTLVNYVPDKVYDKLIKKINESNYKVIEKISDIKYYPNNYDEERFILYMIDSNIVYINLPKFKSINDYDKMVEKFEGKTGKLYLDGGNYFEYNDNKDKKQDKKDDKSNTKKTKKESN